MSNATQDSRNSGDNRRRRSRGGQNRRNNNNQDRRGGDRENRGSRNDRGEASQRVEEFRPQGNRPARKYSPPKLTFWQKILKAIGLYKEPVRPPRPERKPDAVKPATGPGSDAARVKSNIRNARSAESQGVAPAPQEKRREGREPREGGERQPRNRDNNRSRGGDASTVESARVYVGNLSYDVSESDLQDLFKGVGGVRNVEIVYNRSTHRSKGYGFVEMLHVDEAKRSVEVLHDQPFMGRKLTVSGAKSKGQDDREDKEERQERAPRQPQVAVVPAVAAVVAAPVIAEVPATEPEKIETIVETETAPEVAAAVHNVEAVGAPDVIVEAVEHQVTEAVEGHSTEEKQA